MSLLEVAAALLVPLFRGVQFVTLVGGAWSVGSELR
jgi:hypothetical protein